MVSIEKQTINVSISKDILEQFDNLKKTIRPIPNRSRECEKGLIAFIREHSKKGVK